MLITDVLITGPDNNLAINKTFSVLDVVKLAFINENGNDEINWLRGPTEIEQVQEDGMVNVNLDDLKYIEKYQLQELVISGNYLIHNSIHLRILLLAFNIF